MKTAKLDKDEQELLDSVERGEWKSVRDLKGEVKRHQQYAKNTLKKDRRVNIRVWKYLKSKKSRVSIR
jgi:predicted DNA binding CopG/RHH family protein